MSKEVYLMVIDTVCNECNYRNKGEYRLEEPMEIVCCGKCGSILSKPEDMSEKEEENILMCVKQVIEEDEDAIL